MIFSQSISLKNVLEKNKEGVYPTMGEAAFNAKERLVDDAEYPRGKADKLFEKDLIWSGAISKRNRKKVKLFPPRYGRKHGP